LCFILTFVLYIVLVLLLLGIGVAIWANWFY